MEPLLINDKLILQKIYNLRVECWENSNQGQFINNKYFPNGYKDKLDENSHHWIIENDGEIIASSRISIIKNINEIEEDFTKFNLPNNQRIAFFPRLVIHPKYRGIGLAKKMDLVRLDFINKNKISYSIAWTSSNSRYKTLLELGFKYLGDINHKYGENPNISIAPALILKQENINLKT